MYKNGSIDTFQAKKQNPPVKAQVKSPKTAAREQAAGETPGQSQGSAGETTARPQQALRPGPDTSTLSNGKVAVVVAPAEVNDVVGVGHFGGYVADILMEQLLMGDKLRLLDRSVLKAQMAETELAGGTSAMAAKGNSLYLGVEKLKGESAQMAFADNQDLYFQYKGAKNKTRFSNFLIGLGLDSELLQ